MIAKGESISHLRASILYALGREAAVILSKNIVSNSPSEVVKEFKLFQSLNDRCQRNNLSFVLSPTISDGSHLSQSQLSNITETFLSKMKLTNHQYISFIHSNTKHKHIHLYVNRINYKGEAYNDRFISNRSSMVAESIAVSMGLKTAREVQLSRQFMKQVQHPEMSIIKELAQSTLERWDVGSVSEFIEAFNKSGAASGLRTEAYNNKQGVLQGLRFYCGEKRFKASEIDRSLSKKNLENSLQHGISMSQKMSKGLCM